MERDVSIGRSPDNDIVVDSSHVYVSAHHAIIYSVNSNLYFKDTSTNGTVINNSKISHQVKEIFRGDTILLAGKYLLKWEDLYRFYPSLSNQQPKRTYVDLGTLHDTSTAGNLKNDHLSNPRSVEIELSKWNWGAFFLYPFWGFANGMGWLFFISFIPIPLIANVILGINGSRWAWENKRWRDIEHFVEVQRSWKNWGIGLCIAGAILSFLFMLLVFAVAANSPYYY